MEASQQSKTQLNCASSHTHPDANLDAIQAAVVRHGVITSIYSTEGRKRTLERILVLQAVLFF